jgi:hypothetical protein
VGTAFALVQPMFKATSLFAFLLLLISSPGSSTEAIGGPPGFDILYKDLALCMSADQPEQIHALKLPEPNVRPGMAPPVTDDSRAVWYMNDEIASAMKPAEKTELFYSIFPNEEFVFLPHKKQILRKDKKESPFKWEFPEGMTFFHRFEVAEYLNVPQRIFEMRVLKRIKGHWAFGVYAPASSGPCAGRLQLRKNPDDLKVVAYREREGGFNKFEFRGHALDPRSCIQCHGMEDGDSNLTQTNTCGHTYPTFLQKSISYPFQSP